MEISKKQSNSIFLFLGEVCKSEKSVRNIFKKKEKSVKSMTKYFPQILALLFILAFAVYAWQEPTQAPPGGNVETPINVSATGQDKAGSLGATIFRDFDDLNYYLNPSGDSVLSTITLKGGTVLPTCNSSARGKQFLLQGSTGVQDGLYICKKKADDTYGWITLGSPKLVTIWDSQQWGCSTGGAYYLPLDRVCPGPSYTVPAEAEKIICEIHWVEASQGGSDCPLGHGTTMSSEIRYNGVVFTSGGTAMYVGLPRMGKVPGPGTEVINAGSGGLLETSIQVRKSRVDCAGSGTAEYNCYYVAQE